MKYGARIMEKKDYVMMKQFQYLTRYTEGSETTYNCCGLDLSISEAKIYNVVDIPEDVVRLESQVTVMCEWGWRRVFEVVLPHEENKLKGKLSVNSILGALVIGLAEGDCVKYKLLGELTTIKLKNVLQSNEVKATGRGNNIF